VAAPLPVVVAPPAPFALSPGFDLRATVGGARGAVYVVARGRARPVPPEANPSEEELGDERVLARPASRTGSGKPVRILGPRGACDGTLGARVELIAEESSTNDVFQSISAERVVGCSEPGWFAILEPPPAALMPVSLAATDPAGQPAIEVAREAAARVGHLPSGPWLPPKLYRLGDAVYALVAGPECTDPELPCTTEVGAVARARAGQPAELLLVRPAHFVWEQAMDGFFDYPAIVDVDGDGVIELLEHMGAEQGTAVRLVRPGAQPPGDVAWVLTSDSEVPFPLRVGPAPRALAVVAAP
jgi:hypothetical protein